MLITAVCPGCQTRYTLSKVLLGQVIRCPNDKCRIEFAVCHQPGGDAVPPASPSGRGVAGNQWSGSIDDFVPLLPAEPVDPTGDEGGSSPHVGEVLPVVDAELAPMARKPVEAHWNQPPPIRNPQIPVAQPVTAPEPPARKTSPRNGQRAREADKQTRVASRGERATRIEPPPAMNEAARDSSPAAQDQTATPTAGEDPGDVASEPVELPPETWKGEAPPVRRAVHQPQPELASSPAALVPDEGISETQAKRKRGRRLMYVITATVAVCVVGGGTYAFNLYRHREETLRNAAYETFKKDRFKNAEEDFGTLAKRFPASPHVDEYRSMEELSGLLAAITSVSPADAEDVLNRFATFAESHRSDSVVKQWLRPLGTATGKLLGEVIDAEKVNPNEATPKRLEAVQLVLDRSSMLERNIFDPGVRERTESGITEVRRIHGAWARRINARDQVLKLLADARLSPVEAIKPAQLLIRKYEREFQGFGDDPRIKQALEVVYQRHFDSVGFDRAPANLLDKPAAPEINESSLVFAPRVDGANTQRTKDESVVLSLVHGVLYAHSRATGELLWVIRVGVDTTTLPIRVPETASSPERILVLLADSETLVALRPDGNEVWRYRLGSACLGRPVVVELPAGASSTACVLLPTYDGTVHEVELAAGKLLGRWNLGQPLSVGGAREGKSTIVYFPADDTCVYVLNVDPRQPRCQAILYSNHPAGSLRGEPLVVAPQQRIINHEETTLPGFLILNQTDGLLATRLKVFALPLSDRNGPPIALDPQPRLAGWTWFTPFHDGEKVVAVTDEGALGIFGVQQAGNRDPAVFPLIPTTFNLDEVLKPEGKARDRAQVVNARDDDFWFLSRGKLLRLAKTWNAAVGPKLMPAWTEPLDLGSPLHASQIERNRSTGHSTLVVVTQARKRQVCLASAVSDEDGTLLWQREIGLVCKGAAALLGGSAGSAGAANAAPPVVVAMGQSGELFAIDPTNYRGHRSPWISAAKSFLAGPLNDNVDRGPVLLSGPDGLTAYEVAFPGSGDRMVIRRITFDPATREVKKEEKEIQLPGGVFARGTPTLVGNALIVPTSDGVLCRVQVAPLAGDIKAGANWRSARIGSEAVGYIAALGPQTFVSTDGGKGLLYWKVDERGTMFGIVSGRQDDETQGLDLDDRIAAAPLVLPREHNSTPLVLVADASGLLRTIRGTPDTKLEETSIHWDLRGKFTAGPFLRSLPGVGVRVGCVIDGNKLVWIDPKKGNLPLWAYPTPAAIVGEPQIVEGKVVVADQAGNILALDVQTGKPVGPGYTLPGSVAPSAPPVAFDSETLFTPLTDGTVVLVPMTRFR